MDFQDAMFDYMADIIFNEMVPDTYAYTMLLEALISERMKPSIIKKTATE